MRSSMLLFSFLVLAGLPCGIQAKSFQDGLREKETIDKNGAKWVRIVDERTPTKPSEASSRTHPTTAPNSPGIDDEDGDEGLSSGDDGRMENRDFDIAHDEPVRPNNESVQTTSPVISVVPTKHKTNVNTSTTNGTPANVFTTISPVISATTQQAPSTQSLPVSTIAKPTAESRNATTSKSATTPTSKAAVSITVAVTKNPQTGSLGESTVRTTVSVSSQSTTIAHDTAHSTLKAGTTTAAPQTTQRPTTTKSVSTAVSTTAQPTVASTTTTLELQSTEASDAALTTTNTIPTNKENATIIKPTRLNNVSNEYTTSTEKSTVVKIITQQSANRDLPTRSTAEKTAGAVEGQKSPKPKAKKRTVLFGFVTLEILIALLAGALFSILLVAFLVYRLKKRNEGSYELSETIALRPKELDEMSKKKEVFV